MKKDNHCQPPGKKLAAVCGLYCEACTLYIATMEDPQRLRFLAERFQISEEEARCCGCRSDKRGPYCKICKMLACSAERGIDFCVQCEDYPCEELRKFQSERPHRIELWDDLGEIGSDGYENWLKSVRKKYMCPRCGSINSAYDLKCRKCGEDPSCEYVAKHRQAIEQVLKGM